MRPGPTPPAQAHAPVGPHLGPPSPTCSTRVTWAGASGVGRRAPEGRQQGRGGGSRPALHHGPCQALPWPAGLLRGTGWPCSRDVDMRAPVPHPFPAVPSPFQNGEMGTCQLLVETGGEPVGLLSQFVLSQKSASACCFLNQQAKRGGGGGARRHYSG